MARGDAENHKDLDRSCRCAAPSESTAESKQDVEEENLSLASLSLLILGVVLDL